MNKMLFLLLTFSFIGFTAFASPAIMTGKKIECRNQPDGAVAAWFVLDSPGNQSNELEDVLQTYNVRYSIHVSGGAVESQVSIKRVNRPHVVSMSLISTKLLDFEIVGTPFFRIVIEESFREVENFKVETNLNTVGSTPFRSYDNGRSIPKTFAYCQQTNIAM